MNIEQQARRLLRAASPHPTEIDVQTMHEAFHARLVRILRKEEMNELGLDMVKRAAFALYVDARSPMETFPIRDVIAEVNRR